MNEKKWHLKTGPESDIAVSTRVRLARNLSDTPFPGLLPLEGERAVLDRIAAAVFAAGTDESFRLLDLTALSPLEAGSLMEQHLISPELVEKKGPRGVLLSADDAISIMINEEDHLRIQALAPGLDHTNRLRAALTIDCAAEERLPIAFDEKLGYLTKCPTNLGTGLRASVMLHLPALTENRAIVKLSATAGKLGFAVRGLFGEGSTARGALYQISNQTTLGFDENTIVTRLSEIITQFISAERQARSAAMQTGASTISDRVWRSVGILAYARALSCDEAMSLLSSVRMGVGLGVLKKPDIPFLNRLLWEIQPANLSLLSGTSGGASDTELDALRAERMRERFRSIDN